MPAYDKTIINGFLKTLDTSQSHVARGKTFEELACYLVSNIPGVTVTSRNEMNTFATEEIDIACRSVNDPAGLGLLAPFFLVECKGWKHPVNSEQVAWFLMKIDHRGLDLGILIAANGITGVPEHRSASNFLVSFALATRKIRMVIITRAEIEVLNSSEELAQSIIEKVTQLHGSGMCY